MSCRREGIVSLPKTASQQRTLREITNRISTLTDDELARLKTGGFSLGDRMQEHRKLKGVYVTYVNEG